MLNVYARTFMIATFTDGLAEGPLQRLPARAEPAGKSVHHRGWLAGAWRRLVRG